MDPLTESEKVKLLEEVLRQYLVNDFNQHSLTGAGKNYWRLTTFALLGKKGEIATAYFKAFFNKVLEDYVERSVHPRTH